MEKIRRVLIADDDDVVSIGVGALMRRRGFEVETIRTLDEARPEKYDAVLIDPHIGPEQQVSDFISSLRAVNPETEILAVSEYLQSSENNSTADMATLAKPAPVEQYVEAIEARLKLREGNR